MSTVKDTSSARVAITLAALVAVIVLTVLTIDRLSLQRIEQSRAALLAQRLTEVLPGFSFDTGKPGDLLERGDMPDAENDAPFPIQRFWAEERPAAVALTVIAPDGYNGDIRLLLGVDASGVVYGVRVLSHRETPGLGDKIEHRKSNWITHFDGLSLTSTTESDWAVKSRGGSFDAFTGATITPQAVVQAIHRALAWYDVNRQTVFSLSRE